MDFRFHKTVHRCRRGFSLIELLIAMTVIAVLVGVGIAALPSVLQSQEEKKARADLAMIQAGLEEYRARYGTYPKPTEADAVMDMETLLFNALNGKISGTGEATQVKPMLNLSVLNTENSAMPNFTDDTPDSWIDNRVVDPWGNAYVYRFDPEGKNYVSWNNFSYVLFSAGRDGEFDDVTAEGVYNPESAKNLDNINAE